MKYHNIPGIKKTVCTAEQKIAYNIAVSYYDLFINEYNGKKDACMACERQNYISNCVRQMMGFYINAGSNKYDIDSIFCALNAGFENYLNAKHHVLTSFEQVGAMFPANYL